MSSHGYTLKRRVVVASVYVGGSLRQLVIPQRIGNVTVGLCAADVVCAFVCGICGAACGGYVYGFYASDVACYECVVQHTAFLPAYAVVGY